MPLQLMTVETREMKQDGTDGAKCGKVVRETIQVLDSALLVHCAGSPSFPLPRCPGQPSSVDPAFSFLHHHSEAHFLAPLLSSSLFPQPVQQGCLLMPGF